MLENTRKIDVETLFNAILKAATGTIKVISNTLDAAKTIALVTYDVLETLKENGVIVEKPIDTTPATNTRAVSTESKIAFMACQIIMSSLPTEIIESEEQPTDPEVIYVSDGEDMQEGIEEEGAPKKRGKK